MEDADALAYLEVALRDMFGPHAAPERVQGLEAELTAYRSEPDSWRQCARFVKTTDNPEVHWFAHSVFEHTVAHGWDSIPEADKAELREFVYLCIKEQDKSTPSHVANKMYKVYADLGKRDWPADFPDFFQLILEMLRGDRDTLLVGLQLLRVVLEECVSRSGVTARRGAELVDLVSAQVPGVLGALESILHATYEDAADEALKRVVEQRLPTNLGVPPTPRGSPTPFDHLEADGGGPVPVGVAGAAAAVDSAPESPAEPETFFQLGRDAERRVELALGCVSQLFGWVDLAEVVTPDLLDILFLYARLSHSACAPAGALALACFNEMLSSHGVPLTLEAALLKLFDHTLNLLAKVTKPGAEDTESNNPLAEIDPEYNAMLAEFLGLFVTKHFRRVESNAQFQILDFLMLVFRFTLLQEERDRFSACLGVCAAFVDVLSVKLEQCGGDPGCVEAYRPCLTQLATELLDRLRFARHGERLERIDDSGRGGKVDGGGGGGGGGGKGGGGESDAPSQWEEHVRECTDLVAQIASLFPADVVQGAAALYAADADAFMRVGRYVDAPGADGVARMAFPDAESESAMYVACRDLRTTAQLMGKLAPLFVEADVEASMGDAFELVKSMVDLLQFGEERRLHTLGRVFAVIHVELSRAIATYAGWFARALRAFRDHPDEHERLKELTETVIVCVVRLFQDPPADGDPDRLQPAAAELLCQICSVARPPFALDVPIFAGLLAESAAVISQLRGDARSALTVALCHTIVLPWHDVPDDGQEWALRQAKFSEFFNGLFTPLADGTVPSTEWLVDTCKLLSTITRSVRDQPRRVQSVVAKGLSPALPAVLELFESCGSNPDVIASVLDLQLALFESVAPLLGDDFIRTSIAVFVGYFSKDNMHALAIGGEAPALVMETFFRVMQEVVRGRSAVFRAVFPDALGLLVSSVVSLLPDGEGAPVHIQLALFDVLRYVLLDHWRTFFTAQVQPGEAGNSAVDEGAPRHADVLGTILQAMVASFSRPEIGTFKHNLETLVAANKHKRLFSKAFFVKHAYVDMLTALLTAMTAKGHALLEEEMSEAVFELAAANWDAFYLHALPAFVAASARPGLDPARCHALIAGFERVTDRPSFAANLEAFCNDLGHLQGVS